MHNLFCGKDLRRIRGFLLLRIGPRGRAQVGPNPGQTENRGRARGRAGQTSESDPDSWGASKRKPCFGCRDTPPQTKRVRIDVRGPESKIGFCRFFGRLYREIRRVVGACKKRSRFDYAFRTSLSFYGAKVSATAPNCRISATAPTSATGQGRRRPLRPG